LFKKKNKKKAFKKKTKPKKKKSTATVKNPRVLEFFNNYKKTI
jgi:predicted nucleotide-binding protein (sugar kinase/HSP70/actin superfamily)